MQLAGRAFEHTVQVLNEASVILLLDRMIGHIVMVLVDKQELIFAQNSLQVTVNMDDVLSIRVFVQFDRMSAPLALAEFVQLDFLKKEHRDLPMSWTF